MCSESNTSKAIQVVFVSCLAFSCLMAMTKLTRAQPVAILNSPQTANKLGDDSVSTSNSAAEQSFHQFINSKTTQSTVIGELKPDASPLDELLLRKKIASTIKAMEKQQQQTDQTTEPSASGAECFIEVTKVEKIAGKCNRVHNGPAICQSENYMTISNECS